MTTTNTYTPLDQVATVSYSDSTPDVTYTYDADGNRTAMTDGSGTTTSSLRPLRRADQHDERRRGHDRRTATTSTAT